MANTYNLIATATAGTNTSSFNFTSIPATYTDLKVLVSGRTAQAGQTRDYFLIRFNSSATGYSRIWVYGFDSNAVGSGSATGATYGFAGTMNGTVSLASVFNNAEIYVSDYTSSNKKLFSVEAVTENDSTTTWMINFTAGFWDSTSAITSITLFPAGGDISSPLGNFEQYSTAYLYGIKNS